MPETRQPLAEFTHFREMNAAMVAAELPAQ